MAITTSPRGFALLVAIIFMSVMLSLGLALGALGYKQQILASSAVDSQYAFYAADAALECALYSDQQNAIFAYDSNLAADVPTFTCDGANPISASTVTHTGSVWVTTSRLALDDSTCADITFYKYPDNSSSYVFAQGYSISCTALADAATTKVRFSARGLEAHY